MAQKPRGATTEQLRHDIDAGRAADKVRFPDPAAVPLGTDEEAAGTPIPPRVLARQRDVERRGRKPEDAQRAVRGEHGGVLLWLALVGAVIAGFALGLFFTS